MLSHHIGKSGHINRYYCSVLVVILCIFSARTQDAVSVLKAPFSVERTANTDYADIAEQPFNLTRNLIFFPARIDGQTGNFVLDTGAPSLLLNNRGKDVKGHPAPAGVATGGSVALTNQMVESFEIGGRNLGKRWALALDLRSMEQRTGQTIDGFVGHDLLDNKELRINFPDGKFQLRKSVKHPLHKGQEPRKVLKFDFVDHLPVITVKIGKRKLRFAIDTGAGVNIIDEGYKSLLRASGEEMNIQGLDGNSSMNSVVTIPELSIVDPAKLEDISFVSMDLTHLQSSSGAPISGIIGSAFLHDYVVSIDYRRRKLYFW
ncbi:pepsin/retropepsin-like aspartic protease family protein [Neolewinella persica]|uniref:pepsin/retropepsin-like aspartic protease family protein n=1 Tax=Neolewinella persica TaxID=70998 RepID=UPI000A06AB1F|nr:pepsin/retropepsin-like aspartic protease family protein [Neolewinella persica]